MRLRAILAGVMMLAVLLSPSVFAAGTDAYHMVITYPDREYEVGDTVDVTVHVFDAANYVSVDNVTLMVGSFMELRDIEMNEGATGKWTGTFTIKETDLMDVMIYQMVGMSATAEVNSTTVEEAYGTLLMPAAQEEEATLVITSSLDPPSVYTGPGENKTITWEIRYDGQLVNPTSIEGRIYEESSTDIFEPVRSSTGVYTYIYTMPSGPRSTQVDLNIEATYETGTETVDGESDVDLYLNYLHVWAKKGAVSATTASFDLFVSDMSGAPVEAAAVSIDFWYDDDDYDTQSGYTNGTTDADGRASIDLNYNDLGDQATEVEISGKATAQGKEQEIGFDLRVRAETDEPPDPDTIGFDVIPTKEMFDFNKDVNLPATAYFDGEPHGSGTVYWYAYTQHSVLNKGEKSTKVDGTFSVDFRTPAKGTMDPTFLMTHYQTPVEDGITYVYEDTEEAMISSLADIQMPDDPYDALRQFKDSAVKVSVDKLEKNKDVPVTVTYDKADEEWLVAVIVGIDPNPGSMGLVPSWTYWTSSFMTGAYGDICSYDGSKYETTIFLPENLPNNDYYVAGMCVNQRALMGSIIGGNYADFIKTNYVPGLKIGESGSSGENGDSLLDRLMEDFLFGIPLLYWLFIIIIVVVLAIVAGRMMTRKKGTKDLAKPGLEPAEGPSFEGGLGAAVMPMPVTAYDEMQPVTGQAEYAAPPPPVAQPQPGYGEALPPPTAEYAGAPVAPPPVAQPQPEYAAPVAPPQPEYAAPVAPPPVAQPQPEYAAPVAQPQPEYAAPAAPMAPPAAAPMAPEVPPPVPAAPPAPAPAAPPPAAVPPPAVAPAATAPAPDPGATMTIRCQKCQTTLTIPRKRPIKVTCPNCGASGVMR